MVATLWLAATIALSVPFEPQEKETCAAAALTMVMRYWGASVSQEEIARELHENRLHGILGSRLEAFARQRGLFALAYEGDMDQLRESIEKGRPLVVAWKTGRDRYHNVVVVGIDDQRKSVLVNDPAEGASRPVAVTTFEKRWIAAGHWTLLVLPAPAPP